MKMLYLDYAATTPLNNEVGEAYYHLLKDKFANADSIHGLGLEVEGLMEKSRQLLAGLLKVKASELIFTSGASEANNLAIKGVAFRYQNRGKHLITTTVEHSSVYETFKQLETDFGFEVSYIPTLPDGSLDLDALKQALDEKTTLVSIMLVNNEVGMIHPLEEIKKIVKNYPLVHLHVDMVQAFGKIPVSLEGIDLASFSAHKIYGLKGSGLLYKQAKVQLQPQICGGQQEFGLRAGTSNALTNIVFAKTARLALKDLNQKIAHVQKLNQKMRDYFQSLDHCIINSPQDASPYILNVSMLDYKPEVLTHALEEYGIYISTKSACSTKKQEMSRTLKAMGVSEAVGSSALRISFSHLTTEDDIDYFIQSFTAILNHIKKRGNYGV